MSTPTIEQYVLAQKRACSWTPKSVPHLLTADKLRAVLTENEELKAFQAEFAVSAYLDKLAQAERQRDQWRECASELYAPHYIIETSLRAEKLRAALARFDALARKEKL